MTKAAHRKTDEGRPYTVNTVRQHLKSVLETRLYAQDACMLAVTDALVRAIDAKGLTRATVAERIGRTPAFVSQVLNGTRNMTLKTIADILWACGLEVRDLELVPFGRSSVSRARMDAWLDCEHQVVATARLQADATSSRPTAPLTFVYGTGTLYQFSGPAQV
jgi:transcriptional regulator with XRE-family HTH domain